MVSINFSLIKSKNPQIDSNKDIEEIESISLTNCQIEEIDNLELFSHISELILSNNNIQKIENLFFMKKLKILDLSYNNIDAESLLSSFKELPQGLMSINLAGNPCVSNEESLCQLQDAFPDLIIAVELDNPSESKEKYMADIKSTQDQIKADQESKGLDKDTEIGKSNELKPLYLNSDEVLKSIVDRKCKIQSLSSYNIEDAIKELNSTLQATIDHTNNPRKIRKSDQIDLTKFDQNFDNRKQEMINKYEKNKTSYEDVLTRLRESTKEKLFELHQQHVKDIDQIQHQNTNNNNIGNEKNEN